MHAFVCRLFKRVWRIVSRCGLGSVTARIGDCGSLGPGSTPGRGPLSLFQAIGSLGNSAGRGLADTKVLRWRFFTSEILDRMNSFNMLSGVWDGGMEQSCPSLV